MSALIEADRIDEDIPGFLERVRTVFAVFDRKSQDSGHISYGVECDSGRFFVKTAGLPFDTAGV